MSLMILVLLLRHAKAYTKATNCNGAKMCQLQKFSIVVIVHTNLEIAIAHQIAVNLMVHQ